MLWKTKCSLREQTMGETGGETNQVLEQTWLKRNRNYKRKKHTYLHFVDQLTNKRLKLIVTSMPSTPFTRTIPDTCLNSLKKSCKMHKNSRLKIMGSKHLRFRRKYMMSKKVIKSGPEIFNRESSKSFRRTGWRLWRQ